jgi:hypothetical protein
VLVRAPGRCNHVSELPTQDTSSGMSGRTSSVAAMDDGDQIRTIGYGARTIEQFVEAIQAVGTQYLVDVRSAPYSRFKPEFSRGPLAARLAQSGIHYVFMGDAPGGRPDDPSCYDADGRVDYAQCRLRPRFVEGLESLGVGGWAPDRSDVQRGEARGMPSNKAARRGARHHGCAGRSHRRGRATAVARGDHGSDHRRAGHAVRRVPRAHAGQRRTAVDALPAPRGDGGSRSDNGLRPRIALLRAGCRPDFADDPRNAPCTVRETG